MAIHLDRTLFICLEEGCPISDFTDDPKTAAIFELLKSSHDYVVQSYDRWQAHGSFKRTRNIILADRVYRNFYRNNNMFVSFAAPHRVRKHTDLSMLVVADDETVQLGDTLQNVWVIGDMYEAANRQFIKNFAKECGFVEKGFRYDSCFLEKNNKIWPKGAH